MTGVKPVCVPPLIHACLPPHLRVQKALPEWKKLGDQYVSQVVEGGLKLDWIEEFDPENPSAEFAPPWKYPQPEQPPAVAKIIQTWVTQGLLTVQPVKNVKCCSSIFAIPKKEQDEWRLITNLKNLNEFLQTTHFSLPTLKDILPFLHKGMWACKVDIKGAYNHLPIAPRDKPYLNFCYEGQYYRHESLPFGLNVAPREWQRCMLPIINKLRHQGALIWVYLDDFLILGENPQEVAQHTQALLNLLVDLGLEVNTPKSVINPVQSLVFLGFQLDLLQGTLAVPQEKISATILELAKCTKGKPLSKRKLAGVLGKLRSLLFAMPQLRLFSNHLAKMLKVYNALPWEASIHLDQFAVAQVEECIQLVKSWRGRALDLPTVSQTLFTDASDSAWGAVQGDLQDPITGWFTDSQMALHINLKEAEAALQGVLAHAWSNCQLHLFTDNTTLYWGLRRWGSKSPP